MKFQIKKDVIVEVFADVSKAISSKATIPSLTTVKIVAAEEGLTLTGSNSDISIVATIPVEKDDEKLVTINKTGSVCLDAKYFGEIVRKLPTDQVSVEVGENFKTTLSANGSKFDLNGLDAAEYPNLPQVKEENGSTYKITSKGLKSIIKKSIFAVSTQETRPVLTGANWEFKDGVLNNTVTDSHRLVKIPVEVSGEEARTVNIPGSSLKELEKILLDDDSEVKVILTGNQALFELENILFYSRLLEGTFPDVSKLIPEGSQTTVTVNKTMLYKSIDRASVLAKDKNNVVKISTSDGILHILSENPEVGNIEEEVKAQIEGEELKLSASAKYIMDMLNAISGEDVVILFNGAMRPFIANEKDNNKETHLILPVRTY